MSPRPDLYQAGVYRIRVKGILGEHWSDCLGGMDVTIHYERYPPQTILCGPVIDQAALLGVLTTLYNMGYELESVEHQSPD